jgi:menaquinone-9 beta-reductase
LIDSTDVFVVGGGPAGMAVAIAARRRGMRVLVADGGKPPLDKACGEGLLPDGVEALEGLGVRISPADAHRFRGIRFLAGDQSAEALFPDLRCGLAVRRTALHHAMTVRAEQLGARIAWQTPVTGISADGVRLGGCFVRSRWIVGADGANSRVRRWASLDRGPRPRLRYAFRQHFCVAPWTDHMEVYWGKRCQGYATAVSRDQVCVALASHNPYLRLQDGLRELPELAARLKGVVASSAEQGALTGNRRFTRIWRGNVVLVGDASGTVDAISGEGLGLAFRQAAVLAQSLEAGELAHYQLAHRKLAALPTWMARLILTLDQRPGLQTRTLFAFQRHPQLFRRLLALHVGALPASSVVKDGLTLGWKLLTA